MNAESTKNLETQQQTYLWPILQELWPSNPEAEEQRYPSRQVSFCCRKRHRFGPVVGACRMLGTWAWCVHFWVEKKKNTVRVVVESARSKSSPPQSPCLVLVLTFVPLKAKTCASYVAVEHQSDHVTLNLTS